jgi:tetratricopeptide (TPR) repeat protein
MSAKATSLSKYQVQQKQNKGLNMKYFFKLLLPQRLGLPGLLVLCSSVIMAQDDRQLTRSGNKDFNKEKYAEAEVSYRKALEKKNNMPEATFNLGDALLKQQRYEEAAKQFQLSAQTNPDKNIKAKAYHNLGNTYLEQKKYEEAVNAYKSALKQNPKDADTKYNLAYANEMLRQKNQNQDKNQDKKDDKKDDKKEDKKDDKKDDKKQDNKDQKDDKGDKDKDQNADNKNGDKDGDKKPQPQQSKLTKQEAERLLQALQNEEQKANQKMQKANAKPIDVKIEKDW